MIRAFKVFIPTSIVSLFLLETVVVACAFLTAAYLDVEELPRDFVPTWLMNEGLLQITIALATILLGLYFGNFYSGARHWGRVLITQRLCFVLGVALLLQAFLSIARPDWVVPRKLMFMGSALTLVGLMASRLAFQRAMLDVESKRGVLFLGMSPVVVQLANRLQEYPELGLIPKGYLDPEDWGSVGGMQWLGPMNQWLHRVEELQPEWIVIGSRDKVAPEWTDDLVELGFGGVRVEEASTLYESTFGRVCTSECRYSEILFSDAFQYRLVSQNLQALFSITLGIVSAIAALPLMAAIWLALKMKGHERVLIGEERVGMSEQPIRVYRFHTGAGGGWLRRFHLDALPMLWSLAQGDISLIGPRAHRTTFAGLLSERLPLYGLRHMVKPGLMGWAQLNTAGQVYSAQTVLEYDLYYVKYFSPSLDIYILVRTLKDFLLSGRSAAQEEE